MARDRSSRLRLSPVALFRLAVTFVLAVGMFAVGNVPSAQKVAADPVVCQPPAHAEEGPDGTIICVGGEDPGPGDPGPGDPDPVPIPEGKVEIHRMYETCTPNNPNPSEENPGCGGDITTCTEPEVPTNVYWREEIYHRATGWQPTKTSGTEAGEWYTYESTTCRAPAEPTEGDVIRALGRFRFEGQAPTIEPKNGRTLVKFPTNFYVNAEAITEPLPVGPWTVTLTATPKKYEWDFDDRTPVIETTTPGDKYPNMLVKHVYKEAFPQGIKPKVTIYYEVTWQYLNNPPQVIGRLFPATNSPSTPLQVLQSKPTLGDK